QGITEGLYLYLLQKREEAAISSTSASISNYKQIEPAKGTGPIDPIERNILLYATILGLFIPIAIVFIKDSLNETVVSRNDIIKKLKAPILGDINHLTVDQRKGLAIAGRDIISEQFRIVRTNLAILLKNDKAVILITSSSASEGKSTISANLAAVMALPGKKVALLEFDLRKPVITSHLDVDNEKGLSDFLTGSTTNIEEIYTTLPGYPTLHIFPAGIVNANPADILLSRNLENLFRELKDKYDYILIDSAPTGLVSDAFILSEFSDAVLFVIRQRKTLKKQVDFINEIALSRRMKNISVIFNDIKTGGKFGYYGYGNTDGKSYENYLTKTKRKRKKETLLIQG
ncbi:MAG TPA: polysaccharide biosynthesis tyrosine autokinase, partial [Segetibacter sp.]